MAIHKPEVLYETVLEVEERVTLEDYAEDPNPKEIKVPDDSGRSGLVKGLSGEVVRILQKPDLKQVESGLQKLYDDGYRSIAICFMHSYTFPGTKNPFTKLTSDHEILVGKLAEKIGFTHISISSSLMPMVTSPTTKSIDLRSKSYHEEQVPPQMPISLPKSKDTLRGSIKASREISATLQPANPAAHVVNSCNPTAV